MVTRAGIASQCWSGGHHAFHLRYKSTSGKQLSRDSWSGRKSHGGTCSGADRRGYSYSTFNYGDLIPAAKSGVSERRKLRILMEFCE